MPLATWGANLALDGVLGSGVPSSVFVALMRSEPSGTGVTGTQLDEPSGDGYGRVEVANTAPNWPAASGAQKRNGTQIAFPGATGPWGTITHFALCNTATGGEVIGWGNVAPSRNVVDGSEVAFQIDTMTMTAK